MNTSTAPARNAGAQSGMTTRVTVSHGRAPRSAAASRRLLSMRSRVAYNGSTTNGR